MPDIAIQLDAFAMTDRVDDRGYFELDRHTTVRINCRDVTGVRLSGVEPAIVGLLRIRTVKPAHLEKDPDIAEIRLSCGGPQVGDYQVDIESVYGLSGVIFAGRIEFSHIPAHPASA